MLRTVFQAGCVAILLCALTPREGLTQTTPAPEAGSKKAGQLVEQQRQQKKRAIRGRTRSERHSQKLPGKPRPIPELAPKGTSTAQHGSAPAVSNARWNSQSKEWGKPDGGLSFKRAPGCLVPYRIVSQCFVNLPPMRTVDW